jgi:hypothetical protein
MICEKCNKPIPRSSAQNRSLHLYFSFIANELNELGIQYQYTGISGKTFELRYTSSLVKEFLWKPIQASMFDKKSTTQLTTKEMNEIIDVITNFFGERGIVLEFPSMETLLEK